MYDNKTVCYWLKLSIIKPGAHVASMHLMQTVVCVLVYVCVSVCVYVSVSVCMHVCVQYMGRLKIVVLS